MSDFKFLTVDDSPTMRRIIVNTLKRIGYKNVVDAEDGVDGLKKLKENDGINFIVTDWNMPNMDGLTFVTNVRSDPKYAKIPILMVTTKSVKQDIIAAMQAGVNNYIVKPFTPEILKSKIESILEKLN